MILPLCPALRFVARIVTETQYENHRRILTLKIASESDRLNFIVIPEFAFFKALRVFGGHRRRGIGGRVGRVGELNPIAADDLLGGLLAQASHQRDARNRIPRRALRGNHRGEFAGRHFFERFFRRRVVAAVMRDFEKIDARQDFVGFLVKPVFPVAVLRVAGKQQILPAIDK